MKKTILSIIVLLSAFLSVFPHENAETTVKKVAPLNMYTWQLSEDLGVATPPITPDTIPTNFQNTTTDIPYGIANAFLGNMGSPLESKIYFNRKTKSDFIFMKPYSVYYQDVEDISFYNTKVPYTNLAYYRAGSSATREERFKATFAVNVQPKLNFGFNVDYIYGRGVYMYQSTNHILANLFGSYTGKKYNAHGVLALNNFKNYENGGIKDDLFITDPQKAENRQTEYRPQEIPVNLPQNTISHLRSAYFYYNQKYHLGFERTNKQDSTKTDFVPVTTFTHTLKLDIYQKNYTENTSTDFYENTYLYSDRTEDDARLRSIKNVLAVSLNEEFNRFARFGLTAFISNDVRKHHYMQDTLLMSRNESNTSIGGMLAKHMGQRFKYDALGDVCMIGYQAGAFKVSGNLSYQFPFAKDSMKISAHGFIQNIKPDFFLDYYQSNHFRWNENFDNEFKTHVSGKLSIPRWRIHVNAGVENLSNYIYFNDKALPTQHSSNVQVVALSARKDFKLGPVYLENEVTYQKTSSDVLPLPELSLYHNLYFQQLLFKVLTIQLGADLRYHTNYKAPSYMPATGQFYVQNSKNVGNYPFINVYGNFHLKRMRFFVMYYHANYNISEPNYFSMPGYPMNPSMLKIGISWNFYD